MIFAFCHHHRVFSNIIKILTNRQKITNNNIVKRPREVGLVLHPAKLRFLNVR